MMYLELSKGPEGGTEKKVVSQPWSERPEERQEVGSFRSDANSRNDNEMERRTFRNKGLKMNEQRKNYKVRSSLHRRVSRQVYLTSEMEWRGVVP